MSDAAQIAVRDESPGPAEWRSVLAWLVLIFIFSTTPFSAVYTAALIEADLCDGCFRRASRQASKCCITLRARPCTSPEYAVLFGLLARGPMRGRPYLALLFCTVYAFLDERHQIFVPGRIPCCLMSEDQS